MGFKKGDECNIGQAFESWGAFEVGKITEEQRFDVVRHACPGYGACGGMYTANVGVQAAHPVPVADEKT